MALVLKTLDLARAEFKEQLVIAAKERPKVMEMFCNPLNSRQEYEKFATLSGLPLPGQADEGELVPEGSPRKLYNKSWSVTKWGQRIRYSYEAKFTDQYQIFPTLGRQAGQRAMDNRDYLFGQFLNFAFTDSAAYRGADSKPFASTTHGAGDGSPTFSNTVSVGTTLNPVNINAGKAQVRRVLDPNDVPFRYTGDWKLLTVPEKEYTAMELLGSVNQTATADNTMNSAKTKLFAEPVIADFWTSTTAWALIPADKSEHGIFCMYRMPLTTETDVDKQTQNEFIIVTEELVIGWTHAYNTFFNSGA